MTTTRLSDLRIFTDASTYEATPIGNGITGVVNWVVGADYFPDDRWNDFVLVIASWWIDALRELECGKSSVTFRFMDGPFWVDCQRIGTEIHGAFIDDRRGRKVVSSWIQLHSSLKDQVLAFCRNVLSFCDENRISGNDVELLRSGVAVM